MAQQKLAPLTFRQEAYGATFTQYGIGTHHRPKMCESLRLEQPASRLTYTGGIHWREARALLVIPMTLIPLDAASCETHGSRPTRFRAPVEAYRGRAWYLATCSGPVTGSEAAREGMRGNRFVRDALRALTESQEEVAPLKNATKAPRSGHKRGWRESASVQPRDRLCSSKSF